METGYTTTISKANPEGTYLKTTVPAAIWRQLGLKDGDKLNWRLDIKNNNFIIILTPEKKDK